MSQPFTELPPSSKTFIPIGTENFLPIINYGCGKKKCCKRYKKSGKKRCKKCPEKN